MADFSSQRWVFKAETAWVCVCVYLASGRVLSSWDGPSRSSASGDCETQQRYNKPP